MIRQVQFMIRDEMEKLRKEFIRLALMVSEYRSYMQENGVKLIKL